MNTLELLTTRRSSKLLSLPAPDDAQIRDMLQAATQVPDHGLLTPYRFVVIRHEAAMRRFADTLDCAVQELALGEEGLKKAQRVGSMAPLVIAVMASIRKDGGKPEWEQMLTAGCSAYAIQLAAKAQDFDSVWISGKWVESASLREAFACGADEKIIALLMIGTGKEPVDGAKNSALEAFVSWW